MKFCLLLSALVGVQAFALGSNSSTGDDLSDISLTPRDVDPASVLPFIQHEKRDTRPKCSPRTYAATKKRSYSAGSQHSNVTLYRRTMTLPDGTDAAGMDSFMLSEEESDLFEAIVWDKEVNGEPEDMATSMFEQFGDEAFSLGTGFLCGCNYTGHHQSKGSLYCPLLGEHFIQPRPGLGSYLRHSRKGFPSDRDKRSEQGIWPNRDPPEQVSLKNQAPKFEDSYIRAYLMIPDTDYNLNPEGYRPKWNAMKNTINRLVPTLATGDRRREVKYTPLRNRDPQLESTALGRVLFKYDPDHNGRRKATLWFEREATPYHDDEW